MATQEVLVERKSVTKSPKQVELPAIDETLARSQKFFSTLAEEARKPHFGDQSRGFLSALLLRAQEANLYSPESK